VAIAVLRAYDWLYAKLAGDATLAALVGGRIYNHTTPQGSTVTYPFLVFAYLGGADVNGVGAIRIEEQGVYMVKAVTKATAFTPLRAIVDRVDTLLQGKLGPAGVDGNVWGCTREAVDPMPPEIDNGVEYRSIVLRFRIWVAV